MSSKSKKDDAGMLYHVFDCVKLQDWQSQKSTEIYSDRLANLMALIGAGPSVGKSPFRYVNSFSVTRS